MNMNVKDSKYLIAYFSRPGNNYVNGQIVNLPVGNTEVVAKMIREMTGATSSVSKRWMRILRIIQKPPR